MILRDIYAIPEDESRYNPNILELNNPLDMIIQQIDLLLFTKKGDVLLIPDFGCNLEEYLFETTYNEELIKNIIMSQINTYVVNPYGISIDVEVSFLTWDLNVAMLVDIIIEDKKVSSYLV